MSFSPRPLTKTRRLHFQAATPREKWADILDCPEDLAAALSLAAAVMADIRQKKTWAMAWQVATTTAYGLIYKPFGSHIDESDLFADILGTVSAADMAGMQRLYTLAHAGCSAVMGWDETRQRMLHFRCLDWPSAASIAAASRIVVGTRSDGSVAYRAAGIIGMTGLLTAVKPGFSVAINFAPWRGPSLSLNPDPTFLVRGKRSARSKGAARRGPTSSFSTS